jgi:hypothetical protein
MATAAVMIMAAAIAAYAQYQQGKQEEEAMELEAQYREHEGELIASQSLREADSHRKAVRRLIATQRAKLSASGVDIGSGSPLELFAQTAYDGEMDAQDIIYAGKIGKQTKGMAANMARFRGAQAKIAGRWAAAGTLASGTASAYGSYSGGSTNTNQGGYGDLSGNTWGAGGGY